MIEITDGGGYCEACEVHTHPIARVTFADATRARLCVPCAGCATDPDYVPPEEDDGSQDR
jgi:hypothetical protein